MSCNNECAHYLKVTSNMLENGHRLMIGEVFCKKGKRKLTKVETSSGLAPAWCPKGMDKKDIPRIICMNCGNKFTVPETESLCPMCRKEQANQSTKEHRQCDPHYDPPLVDVAAEQNQIPSHENVTVDSQKLRQFVHFTGKKAMDIEELSEMTLETFIGRGLLTSLMDIYHLDQHRDAIVEMDGFEDEQFDRIWEAIQTSRDTTFERYLIALDIPTIARMAGTRLCRQFGGSLDALEAAVDSGYDFAKLQGFGAAMHKNIHEWFEKEENRLAWRKLQQEVTIVPKA